MRRLGCRWVSATAVKPPTRTFNHALGKTGPRPANQGTPGASGGAVMKPYFDVVEIRQTDSNE